MFRVKIIYFENDEDCELTQEWAHLPRIGETIIIHKVPYKVIDVVWEVVTAGVEVTIYTN